MTLNCLNIITLQNLAGIGPATILKIGNFVQSNRMDIKSPQDLLRAILSVKKKCELGVNDVIDAENRAKFIMDKSHENGIGVMGYYDKDFPESLKACMDDSGKIVPSILLYYKGDVSILDMPMIAVIGTREILPEGENAGRYLAGEFAKRGMCIVSGLAIGCDTAGHRGALDAGGKTLAFLAHGLDTVYPPQNKELAEEIVENGGLLVSEYPIGEPMNKYYLVARDRLQAGISQATLVVHTGVTGGTMHAANATLLASKPLFAVKFQSQSVMDDEKCKGNTLLVGKGGRFISGSDDLDNVVKQIVAFKPTLL